MTTKEFRALVWQFYRKNGRHDLPWRFPQLQIQKDGSLDPYQIMVSEIMLQQTQVDRAISFYRDFIKKFPSIEKLATAKLSDVLKSWQGLGYNRRALMLHKTAKIVIKDGMPREVVSLEKLPGVGPYTARAITAFAHNQDVILIETNIRTAIIQHFFPEKNEVSDTDIGKILARVLPKNRARKWYSALMDYGAHLKHSGISHNRRNKKYVTQQKFIGSLREARGAILRELSHGPSSQQKLIKLFGTLRKEQMRRALVDLCTEGLIQKNKNQWLLAE